MSGQDDLAARLMDDMDPKLLEFIRTRVSSFIKWDIVRFFHDNPHTTDTADNIARYIGRDPQALEKELGELVEAGVVQSSLVAGRLVYTLAKDQETRDLVSRFIRACEDRRFRVKAIYHVIRGMG